MLYCKKCGSYREYDDSFCSVCGNRFRELRLPMDLPTGGKQYLIGNKLINLESYCYEMANMFIDVDSYFQKVYKEFVGTISRWQYFDGLFEHAIPYFLETMINVCHSIHKWLCIHGIYDISAEDFASAAINSLPLEEDMEVFQNLADAVGEIVNNISQARAAQRSGRTRWVGGGFGIKGVIKGAITSGILNWGTDILRGIGDSYIDSRDKVKIRQAKGKLTKLINPKLYLSELFLKYFMEIAHQGTFILAQTIPGCPEFFASKPVTDLIWTKIENLRVLYMDGAHGEKFALEYLTQLEAYIYAYPFSINPYLEFIEVIAADPEHLEILAQDMNMDTIYEEALKLRVNRLVFDLKQDFSDMSISRKKYTVNALSRILWGCSEFYNATEQKHICSVYNEKLKNIS